MPTVQKRWTDTEVQFLKDNYYHMPVADIGRHCGGRSVNNVFTKAHRLKLNKKRHPIPIDSRIWAIELANNAIALVSDCDVDMVSQHS